VLVRLDFTPTRFDTWCAPDYFYDVDLSRNEELAHTTGYVDKLLVELVWGVLSRARHPYGGAGPVSVDFRELCRCRVEKSSQVETGAFGVEGTSITKRRC
jgi:hypothetical protein